MPGRWVRLYSDVDNLMSSSRGHFLNALWGMRRWHGHKLGCVAIFGIALVLSLDSLNTRAFESEA